jgi:membrane associated rhomboid family serine protease
VRFPLILPVRDHLPTRSVPFVHYAIIAANIAVFVLEWTTISAGASQVDRSEIAEQMVRTWGLVPRQLFVNPVTGIETVFTSMFMHNPGDLLHIGGNMLFLWIFGDNVEDAMGHVRYLFFYLAGGVCAAAAQVLVSPMSNIPLIGASGAISAVLAAYAFLYPRSPITVVNPLFPPIGWFILGLFLQFPAWLVILAYFLLNLFDAFVMNPANGGTAFMAHVGGFIGGAILLGLFMAGRERMDDYARWQRWAERRRREERDQW